MQTDKNDQLEYYLNSLNELGEVLIDAGDIHSVGSGILRLTLGTVMASTGSVLLYNKEKNFSFLAGQGIKNKEGFSFTEKTIDHLKKYRHGHITLNNTPSWITGKLKNHIAESKFYILLPLFHKELFLGLLCVGNKFMGETYSNNDIKILLIKNFTAEVSVQEHPGQLKKGFTPGVYVRTSKAPCKMTEIKWKLHAKRTNGNKKG